jgi:hypothetical protein
VVAALGVAVAFALTQAKAPYVFRELEARGLRCTWKKLVVDTAGAALDDLDCTLDGAPDVHVAAAHARLDRSPERASFDDVTLTLKGRFHEQLAAFAKAHPRAQGAVVSATNVHLRWSASADYDVTADAEEITSSKDGEATIKRVRSPKVAFAPELDVVWKSEGNSGFRGDFRKTGDDKDAGSIHVAGKELRAELLPIAVARVAPKLAMKGDVSGAIVIALPEDATSPLTGTLKGALTGALPPHPHELDNLLGNTSDLSASFAWKPDASALEITDLKMKSGSFNAKGLGSFAAKRVHAELHATIPCSGAAANQARADLGWLGPIAARAAAKSIEGDVAIALEIDSDLEHVLTAQPKKTIVPHCSVRITF